MLFWENMWWISQGFEYSDKKHEDNGVKLNGVIEVMYSYDVENHLVREDGSTSILSFNCQIFNRDIVHASSSTCSGSILTWKQTTVKETWENIEIS